MYKIHNDKNSSFEQERNGDLPNNGELQSSRHLSFKVVHFFGSCDSIATSLPAKSFHQPPAHLLKTKNRKLPIMFSLFYAVTLFFLIIYIVVERKVVMIL